MEKLLEEVSFTAPPPPGRGGPGPRPPPIAAAGGDLAAERGPEQVHPVAAVTVRRLFPVVRRPGCSCAGTRPRTSTPWPRCGPTRRSRATSAAAAGARGSLGTAAPLCRPLDAARLRLLGRRGAGERRLPRRGRLRRLQARHRAELRRRAEAGWVLAPSAQGRGYATEAVQAVHWADEDLGRRRPVCMISPENAPSRRLALRCGFVEFARATYRDQPTLLFERG